MSKRHRTLCALWIVLVGGEIYSRVAIAQIPILLIEQDPRDKSDYNPTYEQALSRKNRGLSLNNRELRALSGGPDKPVPGTIAYDMAMRAQATPQVVTPATPLATSTPTATPYVQHPTYTPTLHTEANPETVKKERLVIKFTDETTSGATRKKGNGT